LDELEVALFVLEEGYQLFMLFHPLFVLIYLH
jgi:hypothetical protein